MPAPLKTFIIYARADEAHKDQLVLHLRPLTNSRLLEVWHDGNILPGEDWQERIQIELDNSDLVLLLVSANSLNSRFIQDHELKTALDRLRQGVARIVPVIVSHCAWKYDLLLKGLQAEPLFPGKGPMAVEDHVWKTHNQAWTQVVEIIGDMIERLQSVPPPPVQPLQPTPTPLAPTPQIPQPDTILVKGGKFQMGSNENNNEKPIHVVSVADFYMGKYPVTYAQFKAFIDDTLHVTDADQQGTSRIWTGSQWEDKKGVNWRCDAKGNARPASEHNHPVIHVSWNDANAYGQWLTEKTGQTWRLPTEAEWEYAARGGEQGAKDRLTYAGSNNLDEVGWYTENTKDTGTRPVGGKKPNQLGLYDMSGNVWEWCQDWYGDYPSGSQTNPTGPTSGSYRVIRGGSWNDDPTYCRVAVRSYFSPDYRSNVVGFRLARTF